MDNLFLSGQGTFVDPTLDLFDEIERLKKKQNAIILAHYYQEPDIQDIADFVGDSLGLSQQAATTDADVIVFAGVHFMAETAKIVNPSKTVVLPDLKAGCSLADACPADRFEAFISAHPGHRVISYINCSAAVKALSDVICTSSNAVDIVNLFPKEQPLIFAPDKTWVDTFDRKPVVRWSSGMAVVSSTRCSAKKTDAAPFGIRTRSSLRTLSANRIFYVMPNTGSTASLLSFVRNSPHDSFIVLTESGILHQMRKDAPHKP